MGYGSFARASTCTRNMGPIAAREVPATGGMLQQHDARLCTVQANETPKFYTVAYIFF